MYQNILVPIDIQHKSSWTEALPPALFDAKNSGAKLHVMTAVPDIFSGVDWRYAIRGATGGSEEYNLKDMVKQAKDRIEEIIREQVPREVSASAVVKHGTPYKAIIEAAEEVGADLIIMAAHRPSLKDFLLGPTAARVVRHAECSVKVVRNR